MSAPTIPASNPDAPLEQVLGTLTSVLPESRRFECRLDDRIFRALLGTEQSRSETADVPTRDRRVLSGGVEPPLPSLYEVRAKWESRPAVLTLRVLSEPAPQRTCYVLVDITERGA